MFTAVTSHSGKLKAIFELLFYNSQDVVLTISETGIRSELTTVNNTTIMVNLPASAFDEFVFTYDEPLYVGLGSHVNTFFKNIKNKSSVTLTILHPYTLNIIHTCEDMCTVNYTAEYTSSQNICPMQNHQYDMEKSHPMSTNTFNTICKAFKSSTINKSSSVNVQKSEGQLSFGFELAGIASKKMTFGKLDTSQRYRYFNQFKSDAFLRIGKLSLFADKIIKICVEEDKPMMITAESPLGYIKVIMNPEN